MLHFVKIVEFSSKSSVKATIVAVSCLKIVRLTSFNGCYCTVKVFCLHLIAYFLSYRRINSSVIT